ncbi:hypothetical protein IIU_07054 [Bacillus cereus VD133]|uniref:Uncharacterized protein n=1 Tax=Bacillus cereus VD133 TaxID=1053233 RepID=A0A9W5PJ76_BACCE|nr:hypothetical protein [Bacillus cereus]EOO23319.1 hypothetical protein IIU_07054 [Bacillus cereus VD133]
MLKLKSKIKKIIPASMACAALLTVAPLSSFAATQTVQTNTISNQQLEQNVQKIADDLQFIFETASIKKDGKYILDEKKIEEKYGQDQLPAIKVLVKIMNEEGVPAKEIVSLKNPNADLNNDHIRTKRSAYVDCVVDKVIQFTGIGFLTGGIKELISRSAWDLVAKELAKIVGKNALKGGIVGFAASLAWFGYQCK